MKLIGKRVRIGPGAGWLSGKRGRVVRREWGACRHMPLKFVMKTAVVQLDDGLRVTVTKDRLVIDRPKRRR